MYGEVLVGDVTHNIPFYLAVALESTGHHFVGFIGILAIYRNIWEGGNTGKSLEISDIAT